MNNEVCIISAKRTPFGRFLGALAPHSAVELTRRAGEAVLAGLDRQTIDEVIVGNVIGAGQGMNMARQAAVGLGLPIEVPAYTVNMMCGSGMQAVALGASRIRAGEAGVVLCGGSESMSNAPRLLARSREGIPLGEAILEDALLRDGLVDTFDDRHMGRTAETLAREYRLSREEQDAYAATSQERYERALHCGRIGPELAPHPDLEGDEHPRPGTTADALGKLKPAFEKEGSVTAGNASGINDGSAMLLIASRKRAEEAGWPILAQIEASAVTGCDPSRMGLGPAHAIRKLLRHSGGRLADFDAIEINEAFAAQVLACIRELDLETDRVNSDGGAIAVGHPIGASGARLVAHLAYQLHQGNIRHGLSALCIGGGMGIAMALGCP